MLVRAFVFPYYRRARSWMEQGCYWQPLGNETRTLGAHVLCKACAQACDSPRSWATEHLWLSLRLPNTLCNSKVPWNCKGVFLLSPFHNWHSLNCTFKMLVEGRMMPVKTVRVFSIRGVTLLHKQIPYCSLCWHQPPHQHNKDCIFGETFRSHTKIITLRSRRQQNYLKWPHTQSAEKKHIQKVSICEIRLYIPLFLVTCSCAYAES